MTSRATSSPRAGRPAHRPKPHTIDHFRRWAPLLVLDNGRQWKVEPFWLEVFEEVFNGYREVFAMFPTGSYKTTCFAGLGLYHMQFTPEARVPIGAASKDQAAIMYEQASGFVIRTPGLRKRFKVQDGYRRIRCLQTGGLLRVYAADSDTADGIIPSLAFLDELHRQKESRQKSTLYGTWQPKLTKRNGQMLIGSTAGDDEANPAEELREAALRLPVVIESGRHTIARSSPSKTFAMHMYALRPGDDSSDLDLVKMANPAPQVTLDELRARYASPGVKKWEWERFTCNRRAQGEESEIEPETWDGLRETDLVPDLDGEKYGFLDLGWKIDNTGMGVLVWESNERRVIAGPLALEPPVDESDVVVGLLNLQERFGCDVFVYDPNAGGAQMAQQLEKGEHPLQYDDDIRVAHGLPELHGRRLPPLVFVEHSQDNAPMALASSRLDEAMRNGWLVHDGDPVLRRHALNAVAKPLGGDKWKYDRPAKKQGAARRKFPIDLLTGVEMGHSVAYAECTEEDVDRSLYRMEFT